MSVPELTSLLIWYIASVNAVTLVVTAYDKLAAMNFWRRVPEWLILNLSFLGGAPAAKLMQILVGHKMLRNDFTLNLNLIAVFHLTLGIAAWTATTPMLDTLELSDVSPTASTEQEENVPALPRRFGPGS